MDPAPTRTPSTPPAARGPLHWLGPVVHVLLAVAWLGLQLKLILFGIAVGADMVFSQRTSGEEAKWGLACLLIGLLPRPLLSTLPVLAIAYVALVTATIAAWRAMLPATGPDAAIQDALSMLQVLRIDACLLVAWWVAVLLVQHRPTALRGLIVQWWR